MTKIFSNKSTYEGEFKDNEPHGKGVNTLPNGNVQEGEFRKGGLWNGTYKDKDGNLISNVIEAALRLLLTTNLCVVLVGIIKPF